jgi:hypothetical protein
MEEAPENSKESSHSAHANGMNVWNGMKGIAERHTTSKIMNK